MSDKIENLSDEEVIMTLILRTRRYLGFKCKVTYNDLLLIDVSNERGIFETFIQIYEIIYDGVPSYAPYLGAIEEIRWENMFHRLIITETHIIETPIFFWKSRKY
jgi:hypothetical protein